VYLFHGDDEFAINQHAAALQEKLGDPAMAALNLQRLDGRTASLDELHTAVRAMPFLVERRLVFVTHPLARLTSPAARQSFETLLASTPPSTALVLLEYSLLEDESLKKYPSQQIKDHWLVALVKKNPERMYCRACELPQGAEMVRWIQAQAAAGGGQLSAQAAELLSSLVGGDTRLAAQEVAKLLAYVNYRRPVEAEDVDLLTANVAEVDIFAMVDALGNRNGRQAISLLHRLLQERDAQSLFGMVVRQFRLLLLTAEVLEAGGGEAEVVRQARVAGFIARKLIPQARRFSLSDLEAIYRRLLEVDVAVKTGQTEADTALMTLTAALTYSAGRPPR
jgi:DNA polymerase-3 subunit delta